MGHENGPMAHVPFICMQKSRFDGPFEILIGHLEKTMGPGNLNIHLSRFELLMYGAQTKMKLQNNIHSEECIYFMSFMEGHMVE